MRRTRWSVVARSAIVVLVGASLLTGCRISGIVQISGGYNKTCALRTDGTVVCWGAILEMQWDNVSGWTLKPVETSFSPKVVPNLSGATQIGVGRRHACAILSDATVQCWGDNSQGQLGNGTTTSSASPVATLGITTAAALTAGDDVTCALLADESVRCWGANSDGQLGNGTTTPSLSPVTVSGLVDATAVDAGTAHVCARRATGGVSCWGRNTDGQLGNGTKISSSSPVDAAPLADATGVSAGSDRTCAVRSDGTAACWGRAWPQSGTTQPVTVAGVSDATQVSVGDRHVCTRTGDGTAVCWGDGSHGEIGTPYTPGSANVVPGLAGVDEVVAGVAVSCARIGDHSRCWGEGTYGEVGWGDRTGSLAPATVGYPDLLRGVSTIATGLDFGCAARAATSTIKCWGRSVANVSTGYAHHSLAVDGPAVPATVQLAAGSNLVCALTGEGSIQCWGANHHGQLGNGTTNPSPTVPVSVVGIDDAAQVAAGGNTACARREPGTVACWGANAGGQLGDGTTTPRSVPAPVTGLTGVTDIAVGVAHVCAVITGGTVSCWGYNEFGQLGDGTTTNRSTPAPVTGLTDVTGITAGYQHTCALRGDTTVVCWGSDTFGQLGDDGTGASLSPVAVVDVTGASSIASKWHHTCALLADGRAKCWGYNSDLQLAQSSNNTEPAAYMQLAGQDLTGIVSIAAGYHHTCVQRTDGGVRCFGSDLYGQLGDGITPESLTNPVSTPPT